MISEELHSVPATVPAFDVQAIREQFPILHRTVYNKPLVYLDSAATSQKPQMVIDAIVRYYTELNSNIHRGVHRLSQDATAAYEGARKTLKQFINARSTREIIFTRGCTEGVNLVASTFGRSVVGKGDEVLISEMEHHSNIVPWQMLCQEKGAVLRVIPITDSGEIDKSVYESMLSERTKIVSIVHVSNSLGTVNPVKEMIDLAHARSIPVLVDGAQAVPHTPVDVQALDCDFYTVSGHKMYGPTGIGFVYGKAELMEKLPPYQGGGDMILSVTFEKTVYNELPFRYEAGTPNIEGAIALAAAVDFIQGIGYEALAAHEHDVLAYATAVLSDIPGLRIIGTAREKAGVVSFALDSIHPHDVGTYLDREGVAIRTGHHCTQPVMKRYGVPATNRASFAVYNTREEIDVLAAALHGVIAMFR